SRRPAAPGRRPPRVEASGGLEYLFRWQIGSTAPCHDIDGRSLLTRRDWCRRESGERHLGAVILQLPQPTATALTVFDEHDASHVFFRGSHRDDDKPSCRLAGRGLSRRGEAHVSEDADDDTECYPDYPCRDS